MLQIKVKLESPLKTKDLKPPSLHCGSLLHHNEEVLAFATIRHKGAQLQNLLVLEEAFLQTLNL